MLKRTRHFLIVATLIFPVAALRSAATSIS